MSYRPGVWRTTQRAARTAPAAKFARLVPRCVNSMRSPSPANITVCSLNDVARTNRLEANRLAVTDAGVAFTSVNRAFGEIAAQACRR